ncbi:MAG: hypothetical protein Q9214_002491 [Letrouitia sp. 1 TL-2023]
MAGFAPRSQDLVVDNISIRASRPMRKSCHFCRSRKIRCSGQRVCAACSARKLDCVYGREAPKGRPRSTTSYTASAKQSQQTGINSRSPVADTDLSANEDIALPNKRKTISSQNSPIDRPIDRRITTGNSLINEKNIGAELLHRFRRILVDRFALEPQTFEGAQPETVDSGCSISTGHKRTSTRSSNPQGLPGLTSLTCDQLLSSLTQDLVELVLARLSTLGFCPQQNSLSQWFTMSLIQDQSLGIFDEDMNIGTYPEYSDHQLRQMLELWFLHHPLAFIISKTLFLYAYQAENHDEVLLALILGGANTYMRGDESNAACFLFQWAKSRLCHRPVSYLSLSTIQSLILLGWQELSSSNPRRGLCYISMARTAIANFHTHREAGAPKESDWINGLDVGEVKLELNQRMYWLTFALELWAGLQGDLVYRELLPPEVEFKLPPLDELSSSVFILDKQSGNIAALDVQEKAVRGLCVLSHIASTVGYIHALFPRRATSASPSRTHNWESQTISQLRHLFDSQTSLPNICHQVRDILSGGLDEFQGGMGDHSSKALMVIAYRAVIIHLLFPRSSHGSEAIAEDRVLGEIMQCAEALKKVLQDLDPPSALANFFVEYSKSLDALIIVFGFDTCARALDQLYSLQKSRKSIDIDSGGLRYTRLADLSRELHVSSGHPNLRFVSTWSMVKKNLKRVRLLLEDQRSVPTSPTISLWPEKSSTAWVPTPPESDFMPIDNTDLSMLADFIFDGSSVNWNASSNLEDVYRFNPD